MIIQEISAVLTAMLISLVAQTAFGAGGETTTLQNLENQLALTKLLLSSRQKNIKKRSYRSNLLKKRLKMMLISKIYWGLSIANG